MCLTFIRALTAPCVARHTGHIQSQPLVHYRHSKIRGVLWMYQALPDIKQTGMKKTKQNSALSRLWFQMEANVKNKFATRSPEDCSALRTAGTRKMWKDIMFVAANGQRMIARSDTPPMDVIQNMGDTIKNKTVHTCGARCKSLWHSKERASSDCP